MQFLIPIIAASGILVGKLIGKMASDEIKPGMPYFFAAKRAILLILIVLLTFNLNISMQLLFAVLAGAIVGFAFKQIYFWLGFAMLAGLSGNILAVGGLIFIYGLIYGSLEKTVIKNLISFGVPFLFLFTPVSLVLINGFVIGALLINLLTNAN